MNHANPPVSDELLYAFIDGELDPTSAARVAAAVAADPSLAQRLAQQRALREQLAMRFAPVLDEPIPERLRAAIATPDAAVLDLSQARASRAEPPAHRPAWQRWGAQAATLLLGILLGALWFGRDTQPYFQHDGQLLARGELRRALSDRLSQQAPADGIGIGLSIPTSEGICRSFTLATGAAGLACRSQAEWRIDMLASTARDGGDYRLAGSAFPESLRLAIEARAQGEPLSAEQEAIARSSGWRGN